MLKIKLISLAVLVLGAVACEPLPVYPHADAPRRPYLQGQQDPQNQRPPYYGDESGQQNPRPGYDPRYGEEQPPAPTVPRRDEYPTAERTDNPNRVLSPYKPYNVIDVEGFRSGQLAKDPSNGKIFRVP
jgi:hypothetical protein